MASQLISRLKRRRPVWHALHLRAWHWVGSCDPEAGHVDYVVAQLRETLRQDPDVSSASLQSEAGLFLASEVSNSSLVLARLRLEFAEVVSKEDLLPTVRADIPFEVMAQIDFEVAHGVTLPAETDDVATAQGGLSHGAGIYFITSVSSSDQHIVARRKRAPGARTVCYLGQACSSHEQPCPPGATTAPIIGQNRTRV